jgi:anti-sigma-K factor RskA
VSGIDHIDEETIALLALGESVAGSGAEHLRSCSACQSKVDQWRAVVVTARSVTDDDRPLGPPDDLWQAITDEIESDGVVFAKRRATGGLRGGWFALAAAVGILVGSFGTIVALDRSESAPTIAQAQLQPLPGQQVSGVAQVRQTENGPVLMVDVPDLPQPDGYYEVWMLSANTDSMVSIGVLGEGSVNEFPLPAGMDMQAFPVVDISVEQFDGDVTHSGDSLARGTLAT